ncbi:MAG: trp operon repressor [Chlamydiota bacterium]
MRKGNVAEDGWQGFIKLCVETKNPKDLQELFDLFFTLEEKEALGLRMQLIRALLEHKRTQREISEDLNISISKITRGSNALKIINDRLKEYLKASLL